MDQNRTRFRRLATLRTNAVLHRLKVLANCSNRQLYDYDEKDIEKIFAEIERKVRETKAKFHYSRRRTDEFRL
jgi:CHASE1-domain containing sensor protein